MEKISVFRSFLVSTIFSGILIFIVFTFNNLPFTANLTSNDIFSAKSTETTGSNDNFPTSHNICSNQKCLSVDGPGNNECETDNDCKTGNGTAQPPAPPPSDQTPPSGQAPPSGQTQPPSSAAETTAESPVASPLNPAAVTKQIIQTAKKTLESAKEIINTPVGSVATKTVATLGLAATATPSLYELFLGVARLISAMLFSLGWSKKNPPWGTVYDSVTKQPLDPAYLVLKNSQDKKVSSAITDIDGRYGFLADSGLYTISAKKTNYAFPSTKLAEKTGDELYDNLYFGEPIEIKSAGQAIMKNIPLDPLNFDWNEFVKQNKSLAKFYSNWDIALRKMSNIIYLTGFFVSAAAYFAAPYPYNLIVLGLYIFLFVLRMLGLKPKPFGVVIDKNSKAPMSYAILRIFDSFSDIEIGHKITDRYGRYFCLVPKGIYYVKIEKKSDDGSYSLIHVSGDIDVFNTGIIKKEFRIFTEKIPKSQT